MDNPPFTVLLKQEKYLPLGTREVDASLTIIAGNIDGSESPAHAEILIIDCSASMQFPVSKLVAARRAAAAAISLLPDGVAFAVVRGGSRAGMIYPSQDRLVPAGAQTRQAAITALEGLEPDGGTAMGAWLRHARMLFEAYPNSSRHAILLTDGNNESEPAEVFESALDECEGRFVCDALGIGDAWDPTQVRRIATVLRGEAAAVVDDEKLPEHFRRLTTSAMTKTVSDLSIRILTMPFSRIQFLCQRFPRDYDLTDRLDPVQPRLFQLVTGSWAAGDERSYHLRLQVDPAPIPAHGQDRQVATIQLHPAAGTVALPIVANHTDKPPRATHVSTMLRDYSRRDEMTAAVAAGATAYRTGDLAQAERDWARARALAVALGDQQMVRRLNGVLVIDDGPVRRQGTISNSTVLQLLIDVTIPPSTGIALPVEGANVTCPVCSGISPAGAVYCSVCRHRLSTEGS